MNPLLLALALALTPAPGADPVQVFLLVGQSNMEGKGAVAHLESLIADEATRAEFAHLRAREAWVEREDVWISFQRNAGLKAGKLTVGYGSNDAQIGPELGFGCVVGDALDAPVVLIKCSWGGASLKQDFLPPGAGGPGGHWTRMLSETRALLADLGQRFPALHGREHRIAGLVWFQGWNDSVGGGNPDYSDQLAQFIRDVRAELDVPDLPVVIGELGQAGQEPNEGARRFREQQAAVAALEEFAGSVTYVPTGVFIEPRYPELFALWRQCQGAAGRVEGQEQKDAAWAPWRAVEAEWSSIASDRPYHYYGSGKVFYRMGDAFGRAMVALLGED